MRRFLLLGGLLCAACLPCHADTTTVFDLNALLDNGHQTGTAGSATGTLTIDTTTGVVTALDVTAITTSASPIGATSKEFTSVKSQQSLPPNEQVIFSTPTGYVLELFLPDSSLVDFSDGLCTFANYTSPDCGDEVSFYSVGGTGLYFASGTLTPEMTGATPEPSSLALLGTGVLALAGVLRRRFI